MTLENLGFQNKIKLGRNYQRKANGYNKIEK